jgi:Kef-type K+ transport system membrane component KefB
MPVYFVVAGFNVDLSHIGGDGLDELVLILAAAILGKFAGAFLGARSQGLPVRRSAELATLMNTRGLTELIALSIGLQAGLISKDFYALMVVMAVVTTAMSGPLLRWLSGPRGETGGPLPRAADQTPDGGTAALTVKNRQ